MAYAAIGERLVTMCFVQVFSQGRRSRGGLLNPVPTTSGRVSGGSMADSGYSVSSPSWLITCS